MDYQVLVVDNQLGHWVGIRASPGVPITLSDCCWSAASAQVPADMHGSGNLGLHLLKRTERGDM